MPKVRTVLCNDAFDAISTGKTDLHDKLVRKAINRIAKEVEVIVLAQASMARVVPLVEEDVDIPVLASPGLAIERIEVMLEDQDFV